VKVLAENPPELAPSGPPPLTLAFATGIVGFPDHRRGEVFHLPGQLPFQWLRLHGPAAPMYFVLIEPGGLVPDYSPELFDDDATALGIETAADALVFNVVTVRPREQGRTTVNLVGPIIVNRHTGAARQVVIANHAQYDARHPLITAG
jgi:flagellar assembly factor FliW